MSPWQLAATWVVIGVLPSDQGPSPWVTEVDGQTTVVAWTDPDLARKGVPETHDLAQVVVHELVGQLPPGVGMALVQGEQGLRIAADQTGPLAAAGKPFPIGARTVTGEPADPPTAYLEALRAAAADVATVERLFLTGYQVEDAPPQLLLVHEAEDAQAAADLGVHAAEQVGQQGGVLVLALQELPEETRDWLLTTEPVYSRATA